MHRLLIISLLLHFHITQSTSSSNILSISKQIPSPSPSPISPPSPSPVPSPTIPPTVCEATFGDFSFVPECVHPADCENFGAGVECVDGTCGWSCNTNSDCRQGNANPGSNKVCFRGMCTCARNGPGLIDGVDIKRSPHSFICPGTAPCADITSVIPYDAIGCVTDILDCRDNTPDIGAGWNASCATYGTCGIGGYGYSWEFPALRASECWTQTNVGSYLSLPCPMSQRGRCAIPEFVTIHDCGPLYDVECCYCGNKEWTDTDRYCSRTTHDFFDCTKNSDCPGPQNCNYDPVIDYGSCS